MSDIDDPEIPLRMKTYYNIRSRFDPDYSPKYIVIESIILSIISVFLTISIFSDVQLQMLMINTVYLFISVSLLYSADNDDYNSVSIMKFSMKKFLSILLLITTLVILVVFLSGFPSSSYVVCFISMSYITILATRSNNYRGEREYYTNKTESSINHKWIKASVMLEKANKSIKNNEFKSAFYQFKKAEKIYNNIVIAEDKTMLREGANTLSTACTFYAASITSDRRQSLEYQRIAEELFDLAREKLSHRVCSKCGKVKNINSCKLIMRDGEAFTVCIGCYQSQRSRTNSTKGWSKKHNKNKRTKEQRYASGQITKSKYDDISIKEAMETLDINKPITESKINKKFRKKVKKSHPDTGGSENEFKKVKKSKEVLLNEI